jgi:MFS family permease
MLRVRSRAAATFDALHDPHYRILWTGTTLSFLAFSMSWIVQGVVAFEITGKNGDVGIVALGMGLATILTAPIGGVVADRVSKRALLVIGQILIAANFALVGVFIVTDTITIPLLVVSTFVMGLVFSFIAPARQAWIGEILKGGRLANGIALQQVAMTGTRILGPSLAAGLLAIAFVGSGGTYLVMGGIMLLTALTLAQMPPSRKPDNARGSALGDMKLGVTHVAGRPRLALLAISFITVVMFGFSYQVILPGFLHNELGRSTSDMGLLLGVSGISGLVATLAVTNLAATRLAWPALLAGSGVLGIGLIALAAANGLALAIVFMLVVGAGSSVFQMLNNALIVQESDPVYYGRVMALTMMAWGFNSLAGMPFGFLADQIGERSTLSIMGAGVLLITAVTAAVRGAIGSRTAAEPAVPVAADRVV